MRNTKTSKFSSYQRVTSLNLFEFLCDLHWTLWEIKNIFPNITDAILSALSLGSLPGFFRIFFFLFNHMFLFWQSQWWGWGSRGEERKRGKKVVGKHVIFVIFFFSLLFLVRSKNQCELCFINKSSFHVVRENDSRKIYEKLCRVGEDDSSWGNQIFMANLVIQDRYCTAAVPRIPDDATHKQGRSEFDIEEHARRNKRFNRNISTFMSQVFGSIICHTHDIFTGNSSKSIMATKMRFIIAKN